VYQKGVRLGFYANYVQRVENLNMEEIAVDLHGLSETGSKVCLLCFLRWLKTHQDVLLRPGTPNVGVITGWGKHSDGVSKVRNSIRTLLKSGIGRPIPFFTPEGNPGKFQVYRADMLHWLQQFEQETDIILTCIDKEFR
ncbi:hypothetical protein CYMTET_10684, partial [Cymbomonas tetramitiformis]